VTTATTSMTTRMKLRVSTYPSKRLSRTMGYGVQGRVRNEIATPERPPIGCVQRKLPRRGWRREADDGTRSSRQQT
jgi:hypothetical protein